MAYTEIHGTATGALTEAEVVAGSATIVLRIAPSPGRDQVAIAENSGTVTGVEADGPAALDDAGAVFTHGPAPRIRDFGDGAHWVRVADNTGRTLHGYIGTANPDGDNTRVFIYNSAARTTQNWIEGAATGFSFLDTPITYEVFEDVLFHPTVGDDNAKTTALLASIVGPGVEPDGWEADGPVLTHVHVVRDSDYQVTITLPAAAGYALTTLEEELEITVPSEALLGTDDDLPVAYVWIKPGTVIEISGDVTVQTVYGETAVYQTIGAINATANMIWQGKASHRKRPGSSITFPSVNQSLFVGGGNPADATEVPVNDIGLWYLQDANRDWQGTPKVGWNYAGDDATWLAGDELVEAPTAPGDFTGFTESIYEAGGITPTSRLIGVGTAFERTVTAEVANLTRDVKIAGSASGKAHVFYHSTRRGGAKYVEFDNLGPDIGLPVRGPTGDKGRYPDHLHKGDDVASGTRHHGSYREDCVVHHSGSHAFVDHSVSFLRSFRCVTYEVKRHPYWWDPGDQTDFVTWDSCVAFRTHYVGSASNATTHFLIGSSANLTSTAKDCVGVGISNQGSSNGGAFAWPAASNGLPNTWFFKRCVAHNNAVAGFNSWQNTSTDPHNIDSFFGYHNSAGVLTGAYALPGYHFQAVDGGEFILIDNWIGIEQHAGASGPVTRADGYSMSYENVICVNAAGGYTIDSLRRPLATPYPVLFKDIWFAQAAAGKKIRIDDAWQQPVKFDIVFTAGFAGEKLNMADLLSEITIVQASPGAVIRVQDPDSGVSAKSIALDTLTVTDIADFYDYDLLTGAIETGVRRTPDLVGTNEAIGTDITGTVSNLVRTVTAGNILWIAAYVRKNQTDTPAISGGGLTYTPVSSVTDVANPDDRGTAYVWRTIADATGPLTITITFDTASKRVAQVLEYTDQDAAAPVGPDIHTEASNNTGSFIRSLTTSKANARILAFWGGNSGDSSPGTGYAVAARSDTGGLSTAQAWLMTQTRSTTTPDVYEVSSSAVTRPRMTFVEVIGQLDQVPGPPTNVVAVAGVQEAEITWDAPADDGGAPIIEYQVFPERVDGVQTFLSPSVTSETSAVFTDLIADVEWRFSVHPRNSVGVGLGAPSNEVTPTAGGAPAVAWLDPWLNRSEITVDNAGGAAKTDFAIKLVLTAANLDFSKVLANGADLRFTSDDAETLLSHWIQKWDDGAETGTVWVKVPTIGADTTVTIYMYFKNAAVASTSSISDTFPFGEDWSTHYGTVPVVVATVQQRAIHGAVVIGTDIYATCDVTSTTGHKLIKSTDGGLTWTKLQDIATGSKPSPRLTTDGVDKFYVMATDGVFRRYTALGATLDRSATVAGGADPALLWVATNTLIHAYVNGAQVEVRRSLDDGQTFDAVATEVDDFLLAALPEDLRMKVADNGDVLLMGEYEVADLGESALVQWRSTDNGVTWSARENIQPTDGSADNENGDYAVLSNGDVAAVWPSDVDTTVSYDKNQLFKRLSADDGATWGAASKVRDDYSWVAVSAVQLSDVILVFATRFHNSVLETADEAIGATHRLDDPLLSAGGWTQTQGMAFVYRSGAARYLRIAKYGATVGLIVNSDTGSNYAVHCRARSIGASNPAIRLLARYTDASNFYRLTITNAGVFLTRQLAGTGVNIDTDTVTLLGADATWYEMEMRLQGTALSGLVNGTELVSATDANFASGKIGVATSGARVHDFDYVFRRPYDGVDPTQAVGAEEDAPVEAGGGGFIAAWARGANVVMIGGV